MTPKFNMSNQQPTGYSWSSPAGSTPTFGASSSTPVGGHSKIASGAAYNPAGAGATATLVPTPTEGSMTSTHIAPPGPPCAPTSAGAPTMAASFANAPVAPVPAPPGGLPTPNHYIATPRAAYAPSLGASATTRSTNVLYPVGNPHAAPGYTYQH